MPGWGADLVVGEVAGLRLINVDLRGPATRPRIAVRNVTDATRDNMPLE